MKRDKEWIDALRSRLRDAETPPPANGWARLEQELGRSDAGAEPAGMRRAEETSTEAPRSEASVWRIRRLRIVAAAAAVALLIGAGELFLRQGDGFRELEGIATPLAEIGKRSEESLPAVLPETDARAAVKSDAAVASAEPSAAKVSALRSPVHRAEAQGKAVSPSGPARRQGAASDEERPAKRGAKMLSSRRGEPNVSAPQAEERRPDMEQRACPEKNPEDSATKDLSGPSVRKGPGYSAYDEGDLLAYAPPRRKASFSLYAGGALTNGNRSRGTSGNFVANMDGKPHDGSGEPSSEGDGSALEYYDRNSNSFKHHQPLSLGLSLRKEFAHGLSLETGVNYTLLRSEVSYWKGAEEFSQKLHFIGVPLRLNWQFFEQGRFCAYIGAGGMLEKCVAAKFGTRSVDEPGLQWSVTGAAGAQYRLGRVVGLYFEPEISYYFTDTRLRTSRTDAPLTLTLRLGVRFSF